MQLFKLPGQQVYFLKVTACFILFFSKLDEARIDGLRDTLHGWRFIPLVTFFPRINRVRVIGRGRKADDASFSRIQEAVEGVATSQADIIDRFNVLETRHQQDSKKITSLTTELTALTEKLRTQDGDPQNRFTATGAASDQLADF